MAYDVNTSTPLVYDSGTGGGLTHTGSYAVRAADDVLVADIALASAGYPVSSVVIDPGGANEASFSPAVASSDGSNGAVEQWVLESGLPPSGSSYSVTVTLAGSAKCSFVVTGVGGATWNASDPTAANAAADGATTSVSITTDEANMLVIDAASSRDAGENLTKNAAQTLVGFTNTGRTIGMSYKEVASAGSTTMSWTADDGYNVGNIAAIALAPAGGGTPDNLPLLQAIGEV